MTTTITYADLQAGARPGGEVVVEGGGEVRGADLSNWNSAWLLFSDGAGLLSEILPRPLKPARPGRHIPVFVDCEFSGLTCRRFDPGIARFLRCRFADVAVKLNVGTTNAHFRNCLFSGRWEGNFDARPAGHDPARRVVIEGNSFVGCTEFSIQGGVDRRANEFDTDLHLVIERDGPGWDRVRALAATDRHLSQRSARFRAAAPSILGRTGRCCTKGIGPTISGPSFARRPALKVALRPVWAGTPGSWRS